MEASIASLISTVISGGGPISALLVLIIIGLIWIIRNLNAKLEKKDEKIYDIIEQYRSGNITVAQALDGLKGILYEIKGKI